MKKAYFFWSSYHQSASVSFADSEKWYDLKLTRDEILEMDLDSYLGEANYVNDYEVDDKKKELFSQYLLSDEFKVFVESERKKGTYSDDSDNEDIARDIEFYKSEELYQEFLSKQDTDSKWHSNPDTSWQYDWTLEYFTSFENEDEFLQSILDDLDQSS